MKGKTVLIVADCAAHCKPSRAYCGARSVIAEHATSPEQARLSLILARPDVVLLGSGADAARTRRQADAHGAVVLHLPCSNSHFDRGNCATVATYIRNVIGSLVHDRAS